MRSGDGVTLSSRVRPLSIGIRNNMVSRMAAGKLQKTQQGLARSAQRIASGSRIDRAGQDASGAAVAVNLSTRVSSVKQAVRNTNDAISLLSTNEAAAQTFADTLTRMRELAVQSSSETLHGHERKHVQREFTQHVAELRRLVFATTFNGANIVSGATRTVQVGADNDRNHQIDISGANLKNVQVQVASSDVSSASNAQLAIGAVDKAMDVLNTGRSNLGGEMNRLEAAIGNATAEIEALSGAASRIYDTDMALETAHMTALQVKAQAGISALAQARELSAPVISLIG